MPLQFALRREDFSTLALGLVDVESRVRLAKFFECSISRFERIVEMTRLVVLVEKGAINQGEIHLGKGPIERHARAGIFLQGLAIGGDGLLKPRRPALPLAEPPKCSAEIFLDPPI
jgi:hypothetical protein